MIHTLNHVWKSWDILDFLGFFFHILATMGLFLPFFFNFLWCSQGGDHAKADWGKFLLLTKYERGKKIKKILIHFLIHTLNHVWKSWDILDFFSTFWLLFSRKSLHLRQIKQFWSFATVRNFALQNSKGFLWLGLGFGFRVKNNSRAMSRP